MKEVLKFLSNDYLSSYSELLEKYSAVSLEIKRLCMMVCEILKTSVKQFKSSFYEICFITHQMLLMKSIILIYTSILKIQQSSEKRV